MDKHIILEKNEFKYDKCHQVWGVLNLIPKLSNIKKNIVFVFFIDIISDENNSLCKGIIRYIFSTLESDYIVTIIINGVIIFDHVKLNFFSENYQNKFEIFISTPLNNCMNEIKKYEFTRSYINEHIIVITDVDFISDTSNVYIPLSNMDIIHIGDNDGENLYKLTTLTNGKYYHMNNVEILPDILQCISKYIFVPICSSIKIRLLGHDGCRIISIYGSHKFIENSKSKDYSIDIDNLSSNQSILFKLSLRNLPNPNIHKILNVETEINNLHTSDSIFVDRIDSSLSSTNDDYILNLIINQQLNRYNMINCILDCIKYINKMNSIMTHNEIYTTIKKISNSSSSHINYCKLMISDLVICDKMVSYKNGINFYYMILSKYITENY